MEGHLQVDTSDAESERDPLLVQRMSGPSKLKRMIALLMEWETRYAKAAVERKRRRTFAEERDDEADLDMFGRPDERHDMEFDWAHFFFTLARGMFLCAFALAYLFSARFSWRAKLAMVGLGMVNVGVVAMPIVAYAWPPAADGGFQTELGLVWAPLVFYVTLVLVHSTVEGHWKDTGGSAASLQYLNNYECAVSAWPAAAGGHERVTQAMRGGDGHERVSQAMRAGDLVSLLIETEQARRDPWEYVFLMWILAPVLGILKAGLFLLVDYLLVQSVNISGVAMVHVVFALSMALNAVCMTAFLMLLALSAYVYRRQLLLLRLVAATASKVESARHRIPFLPLRSVANLRCWSAMRTFAMADKSHLPLSSANTVVGYTLLLTAILWIVLLVKVFVDRSQKTLLS